MTGEQHAYFIEVNQYIDQRFGRRIYDALRQDLLPCHCNRECGNLQRWSTLEVGYGSGRTTSTAKGFHIRPVDLSFGAHTGLNPCTHIGAALNLETNKFSFLLGGSSTMYTYQGALYGSYSQESFYFFSDPIIGQSFLKFQRPINFAAIDRHAKSTHRLTHANCYQELGWNASFDCLLLQPFVGADLNLVHNGALHEHGAESLNLHIKSKRITNWDSYLGLHINQCYGDYCTINLDLAWQHRFGSLGTSFRAHFEDFGHPFTIHGSKPGSNAFLADLNISSEINDCIDFFTEFSGEWRSHWSSYSLSAGFLWDF